ncbi:MAG: bifunctional phosphoribosylaminoimidazolecarboxamide formyltransferase/IMP cyclohydrolase [Candidatus Kryptoniota bacterium]
MKISRALISVTDKTGLDEFAKFLEGYGVEIFSTGGTLRFLVNNGVAARSITELTKFPEILDGRVKTLHPGIFAGILAKKQSAEHLNQMRELSLVLFDLVVVNLYRFEEAVGSGAALSECIENIDIGGPSLIRAAAKNYESCAVVVDPIQYPLVMSEMTNGGTIGIATREELATQAFERIAEYDIAIAQYFRKRFFHEKKLHDPLLVGAGISMNLRYGENPHQTAAFYGNFEEFFEKIHGKELSYNNLVDIDAAQKLIQEFDEPACAIIKHTNPCGAAVADNILEAYQKALKTDSKSAFGGIVAFNREIDEKLAEILNQIFLEVVIAPSYTEAAIQILKKKKDRRFLRSIKRIQPQVEIKTSCGGYVAQESDMTLLDMNKLKIVTRRQPTDEEMIDMIFAYKVCKHVKSNAIVFAKNQLTLGVGAGQMSRVDSVKVARSKATEAGLSLQNSIAASDAFFPFADNVEEIAAAGATAIIQPGGSVRDAESIEAADRHGIAMVFTGIRHFKH